MIALVGVPVLMAIMLGAGADRVARRLQPAVAVRMLTALALTVALCTGLVLSAISVLVFAQVGPLPHLGRWSAPTLRTHLGIPEAVGFVAAAVVVLCLVTAIGRAVRSVRALLTARRAATALTPTTGHLVIVDDQVPLAYAVASTPQRIVVSTAMLTALSADERRALLAHEESHLRHRHYLYVHAAGLAAAANPLLRSTARVIEHQVERWADEDAAHEVGDRALTAQALARAALARAGRAPVRHALAGADNRVADRVGLLLAPAPVHRWPLPVTIAAAGVLSWASAVVVTVWAHGLIEFAERIYERR